MTAAEGIIRHSLPLQDIEMAAPESPAQAESILIEVKMVAQG